MSSLPLLVVREGGWGALAVCGCGWWDGGREEMLERREDEKRFMRKLKIIFTSSSRSQYSRSRARSSVMDVSGAGFEASGGSSSIPQSEASL